MQPLNVAIIGGGPAGLTLANLLVSKAIDVTVFERDDSPTSRATKGGTLDLHADTGLAAIEAAGLRTAFDTYARNDFSSSVMIIADRRGEPAVRITGNQETGNSRPEIDRGDLRTLLVDALPAHTIRWGSHVSSISPDGTIHFNGSHSTESTTGKYDLIVGAEGAWSKVRAHITDTRPVFSGIGGFELHITHPDSEHPNISKTVGNGLYCASGGGRGLIGQRLSTGAIMVYAFSRLDDAQEPQELINKCDNDLAKVQKEVKRRYEEAGYSPEMCEWISSANPTTIRGWPLYDYNLPDGHVFTHKPGFTVIGDAAHVMTPFAGEGVNAAMIDALELAKLIKGVIDVDMERRAEALDKAVKEYEAEMFVRARSVMEETMENKIAMFEDDAPKALKGRMEIFAARNSELGQEGY